MGVWRGIFGWKALFRWDALGVIVPGIFIAVGVGVMSVDWFPYHLLIAQIFFAVAGVLCVIKFVGHAIESEGSRTSRWLFGIMLSSIVIALTIWVDYSIQMHKELVVLRSPEPLLTPPNQGETPPPQQPQPHIRIKAAPKPETGAPVPAMQTPQSQPDASGKTSQSPVKTQQCETGSLCNQDSTVNAPQRVENNFERPYRHLSDAQRSALQTLSDELPSDSSFLHIEIVNEPEALKYGNEIADYFRSKTKTIGVGLSYPRGMPEGVYVQTDGPTDPTYPMAQKIAGALSSCGILEDKNFVGFQTPHPGEVYIFIGVRPEN